MHLQQGFPLRGVGMRFASTDLLRNRNPELRGEVFDGIDEPELFLQLEEFENVAPHAAAETVEEPFVAVDVERRALLGVERAEALVGGS